LRAGDLRAVAFFRPPLDLRRVDRFAAFFGMWFTSPHRSDDL
jgi:hypothetical protein